MDFGLRDGGECSSLGVDDVATDGDIGRHQRVIAHEVDCLLDGAMGVFKAMQPLVEIDAAVFHEVDVLV